MNSAQKHILECAAESGVDLDEECAVSDELTHPDGLQTWYKEAAIFKPFRAWKNGFAVEGRGWSVEESIADWETRTGQKAQRLPQFLLPDGSSTK